MELKVATLRALQHMGSELKGHVNAASIAHLDEMLEKMEEVWQKVEKTTETRQQGVHLIIVHIHVCAFIMTHCTYRLCLLVGVVLGECLYGYLMFCARASVGASVHLL